jgi:hypothetical protein
MLPVISALLAFIAGLFHSRVSLCLEHLASQHQLAVYKQTVHRPRLRPTHRLFWAWLSRLPRPIQRPGDGSIREIPEVGGLHHHYERRAA